MNDSVRLSSWVCDACERTLNHGEYRYNCAVCTDYDQCETCYQSKQTPHPHRMDRELAYGSVEKTTWYMTHMESALRTIFRLYHDRHCMGTRDRDPNNPSIYLDSYTWLTYQTISDRKENFGHGLRQLVDERSYVAICAENRPEWLIVDMACMCQNLVTVPIYCLFNDSEITFVMNNTQISVVVCDQTMLKRFISFGKTCPSLVHIICMDPIPDDILESNQDTHLLVHYMGDIEERGKQKTYSHRMTEPDECLTIIYTSGSSGFPKGAIISEAAYRKTFNEYYSSSYPERIKFVYRPLAWAADRDGTYLTLFCGGRVGFSTHDVNRLMEELALVRPTQFSAPPSVWNKIYAEFKAALALATHSQSDEDKAEEKRLLKEFSKLIPNRCRTLTVGSAKISSTVFEFMKRCFRQCDINESYGITECGGVAYNSGLEGNVEYLLDSVPEMGYTVDDKPFPRGELLVRTQQMFSGYVNNPEETNASLTQNGFFRTGDIVEMRGDPKRAPEIIVIDRKKSIFKLAQGQFVSPEFLQGIFIQSPFVEQIYIHGDITANCVSAVVVPNRDYTEKFIKEHRIENFDYNNPDRRFYRALLENLRTIGNKASLRQHEIPSHLVIDFEPFTPENGRLTSSMKQCRYKIAAHYADRLRSSNDLEQQLKSIIERATGQSMPDNDEDRSFLSIGGDSLTAVRLSRMIENDLGIPIPMNMLFESTMNIQRLTQLIQNPSEISAISKSFAERLRNDARMALNCKAGSWNKAKTDPTMILVTGATGFVGTFLLAELLKIYPSSCKFICLVRSKGSRDIVEAIRDSMIFYQIWSDDYRHRIIPLQGDLSEPHFGLTDDQYDWLAHSIDLIYHCGAIVNFILSYDQLYRANVLGTREIIHLATYTSNYIPVQYVSTISVLSSEYDDEISIEKTSPDGLRSGYAQSKWVAEKLIARAIQHGLPAVIYRLGLIGPCAKTGASNKQDLNTLLIAAMIKVQCYPSRAIVAHFDGLPVDFTAKAIVYLSRRESKAYGNIYHVLNNVNYLSFEQLVRVSERCEIPWREVSDEVWSKKIEEISQKNGTFESVGKYLLDSALNNRATLSNKHFARETSHFQYPELDDAYVDKWLKFISRHMEFWWSS